MGDLDIELLRYYELLLACRDGEKLSIEGVEFDLNHGDLSRDEWEPLHILGDFPGAKYQPAISFPWTTSQDLARIQARGEYVEIRGGDRIVIRNIEVFKLPPSSVGKLDHPHHQQRRLVSLSVERRGEADIAIPGVWLFTGVADVMTPIMLKDEDNVRRALISRFERMVGLEDLLDNVNDEDEKVWNARFRGLDQDAQLAALMLWRAEYETQNNAAMAFGYLMGRAEGRYGRREQAKSASKAPRKTGDQARAAAIELIEASPRIVLRRCAEQVAEKLGKGPRAVEATISVLFSEGTDGVSRPDSLKVEAFRAQLAGRT